MMETADIELPVYITDCFCGDACPEDVLKQFDGRNEFRLGFMNEIKHSQEKPDRWHIVQACVRRAIDEKEDLFILCEYDHIFTARYDRDYLFSNIIGAYNQGCDILCGGVGSFHDAVPLTRNRYWVDNFLISSFTVIYRKLYRRILDEPHTESLTPDQILSKITSHKMVLYPFISVRHYTKADNLSPLQCEIMYRFSESGFRLKTYKRIFEQLNR